MFLTFLILPKVIQQIVWVFIRTINKIPLCLNKKINLFVECRYVNMKFFSPNIACKYLFRLNYQQFLTNLLERRLNSITYFVYLQVALKLFHVFCGNDSIVIKWKTSQQIQRQRQTSTIGINRFQIVETLSSVKHLFK